MLSPIGTAWAKNFNKIVFLSPCLDEGFVSELNLVSKAEIFLPIDRPADTQRFANLDLSRETFGRVFKALTGRAGRFYSIFDQYNSKMKGKVNFDTFYAAFLVFKELGLVETKQDVLFEIMPVKNVKKELSQSKLYNKLLLLKNSLTEKK